MARRFFGRQRRYPRTAASAAAVTRSKARRIVRKAGPMDRRFWMYSSMTDTSNPAPTLYAANSTLQSIVPFHVFAATDYMD